MKYSFSLNPGEEVEYLLAVPFYPEKFDTAFCNITNPSAFIKSELRKGDIILGKN